VIRSLRNGVPLVMLFLLGAEEMMHKQRDRKICKLVRIDIDRALLLGSKYIWDPSGAKLIL